MIQVVESESKTKIWGKLAFGIAFCVSLSGCTPVPMQSATTARVPEVELNTEAMRSIHTSITKEYRPILQRSCSAEEMKVVEAAWRFQTYSMFVSGGLAKGATLEQLEIGTENTISAINALSPTCRRAYWKYQ